MYHEAIELIGRRWTGAIVSVLIHRTTLRFGEIATAVPELSDRLLSERMKELEARGVVVRNVRPGRPVRVEYELTEMGRELAPAVRELEAWAQRWLAALSTPAPKPPDAKSCEPVTRLRRMTDDRPKTPDDVKAIVAERDIRFIRLWFTDILGQLKSFSINRAELDDAFEGGMGFDGSSITGFNAIEESDMLAMPDPSTFAILPWRPEEQGVGAPVLRRAHARAHALRGRSAPRAAARAQARRAHGLRHVQRRPRARVLPLSRLQGPPRSSTTAATST